jgi:hypothetical protein
MRGYIWKIISLVLLLVLIYVAIPHPWALRDPAPLMAKLSEGCPLPEGVKNYENPERSVFDPDLRLKKEKDGEYTLRIKERVLIDVKELVEGGRPPLAVS